MLACFSYLRAAAAATGEAEAATGEAAGKATRAVTEEVAEREEDAETAAVEACAASTSHHASQCGREQQRNRGDSDFARCESEDLERGDRELPLER
jgi:hypothetical protein